MPTLKNYKPAIRPVRRPPTPKRKPARLSSEVAKFRGHENRKRGK